MSFDRSELTYLARLIRKVIIRGRKMAGYFLRKDTRAHLMSQSKLWALNVRSTMVCSEPPMVRNHLF